MARSILFDLDGTLSDSGEGIMNCAAFALEQLGLPVPPPQSLRLFVGPPLGDMFQRFGVRADQVDEAIRLYRSRYLPIGQYENYLYPGITDLLKRLQAEGHHLYVATSKPETTAISVMKHFGIDGFFRIVAGATMDSSRETKSQVIAYLLDQIGSVTDAIMVGDTAYDVIGAAEHGIPTVGVSWGYGETADMEKAGAKAIAHTMDELYDMLTK